MDAFVLVRKACRDSQIEIGLSKFGGNPDLPDDFQLDFDFQFFLGQVNFSQLKECDQISLLPDAGLLSLFVNLPQDGPYAVHARYFVSIDRLKRILLPPKKHPCHPCRLTSQPFQSMPPADLRTDEYLLYERTFLKRFYPQKENFDFDTPWHQMLGFSRNIAQRKESFETNNDRILLLQVDSDSLVSMSWGYSGQLNFWIRPSDLEAQSFAAIEVELAQAKRGL